ncbi:proteoglycan 4 isoform X2 [Scaptodrosophila lebanonensis]|uniref:Proteoglycan 4 isoform X2 n=1 Tax=Drosophila lebanonensis TaxID=7225 RepID=A0A6J2T3D9_DROLE|nr:proteoglycan 4 isoform X2 [Scaptodrosophila lebanonensis]
MFENSLMIIKSDYLHKRRPVLLKLLSKDFQIQANRKINFSPELAAEFYVDNADEEGFMLDVIELSKGTAEAFILTKENGVEELRNTMICYFTSASEMEHNVHVTKLPDNVAREINFIFPNYIHEPTPMFDRHNFCNRPMLKPLIAEIYDILQNADCSQDNWKVRVSDYLIRSNPALPQVTNQCTMRPEVGVQERSQQTVVSYASPAKAAQPADYKSMSSSTAQPSSTSPHSSMLLTSSSCLTCGGFDRTQPCSSEMDFNKRVEPIEDERICEDEEIIWKEVIVYEEIMPEEQQPEHLSEEELEEEGGGIEKYAGMDSDVESDHSGNAAPVAHTEPESSEEAAPAPETLAPEPAPPEPAPPEPAAPESAAPESAAPEPPVSVPEPPPPAQPAEAETPAPTTPAPEPEPEPQPEAQPEPEAQAEPPAGDESAEPQEERLEPVA